ncbi:gamma-glutamylcyclotransferase family protein [Caminibacter pacificus]
MIVFVYGSLKRGKRLHSYLKNAKFLGEGVTCRPYPLIVSKSGWYPYLIEKNGGYKIKGEVYKITPKLLKILDKIEESPNYYYRKKICVKINGKTVKAWTYFVRKPPKFTKKELIKEF